MIGDGLIKRRIGKKAIFRYGKNNIVALIALVAIGIAYKLKFIFLILLVLGMGLMIPVVNHQKKKKEYLKERFDSVVSYMEQLCYSFKKTAKIRNALIDAQKISEGEMKEIIEEAIVNIDSRMNDEIYEEALDIIEEEYRCKRMESLHKFIIKIEKQGGEYEEYIDILLVDIKEWSNRTELFRRDVDRINRNVLISIGATLITCGFMAYLIPKNYAYTDNVVYQICSTILIILMIVIYAAVYKKLNIDWLNEDSALSDVMIDRYYNIMEMEPGEKLKLSEKLSIRNVKKRLEKEITKAYPEWLRELALNLQLQTVQTAVEHSYVQAPYVMKRPIRQLLVDFEEYPIGIEPYDNFLSKFDLPDIHSSVKMLYCVNELSKEETCKQTNNIIDRNNKMAQQAQTMKNQDKIGVAGMLSSIPMFAGVIKIIIDMVLMILVFTAAIGGMMNGGAG